jgi:hypothetical protein
MGRELKSHPPETRTFELRTCRTAGGATFPVYTAKGTGPFKDYQIAEAFEKWRELNPDLTDPPKE